jgi:hypothetical protein
MQSTSSKKESIGPSNQEETWTRLRQVIEEEANKLNIDKANKIVGLAKYLAQDKRLDGFCFKYKRDGMLNNLTNKDLDGLHSRSYGTLSMIANRVNAVLGLAKDTICDCNTSGLEYIDLEEEILGNAAQLIYDNAKGQALWFLTYGGGHTIPVYLEVDKNGNKQIILCSSDNSVGKREPTAKTDNIKQEAEESEACKYVNGQQRIDVINHIILPDLRGDPLSSDKQFKNDIYEKIKKIADALDQKGWDDAKKNGSVLQPCCQWSTVSCAFATVIGGLRVFFGDRSVQNYQTHEGNNIHQIAQNYIDIATILNGTDKEVGQALLRIYNYAQAQPGHVEVDQKILQRINDLALGQCIPFYANFTDAKVLQNDVKDITKYSALVGKHGEETVIAYLEKRKDSQQVLYNLVYQESGKPVESGLYEEIESHFKEKALNFIRDKLEECKEYNLQCGELEQLELVAQIKQIKKVHQPDTSSSVSRIARTDSVQLNEQQLANQNKSNEHPINEGRGVLSGTTPITESDANQTAATTSTEQKQNAQQSSQPSKIAKPSLFVFAVSVCMALACGVASAMINDQKTSQGLVFASVCAGVVVMISIFAFLVEKSTAKSCLNDATAERISGSQSLSSV